MKLNTEEEKVYWVVGNTVLNNYYDSENVDYLKEALDWTKSDNYFPNLKDEEIFSILRKYKVWNDFEKECIK
jgi:hypothetical protein